MLLDTEPTAPRLHAVQIEDLKLASSKMSGAQRRSFQAAMTLKYCRCSARQAERVFGWNRDTVELGLVLAEAPSQQDPTFRTAQSYTRLTAAGALEQLRAQGFPEDQLPSSSTMAEVLNRNGYRLRKVVKAKPQKNSRKRTLSSLTSRKRMESPPRQQTPMRRRRSSA
jgi:hypothetical protein